MDGQLVVARVPLPGYNGKVVDRGEVFKLIGARNDEKMIGLRMLLPFDQKHIEQFHAICVVENSRRNLYIMLINGRSLVMKIHNLRRERKPRN